MKTKQSEAQILLGICGGVAAYKAVDVASRLRQAGHHIRVAMSDAAQRFVTPLTFSAVSGQPALHRLFADNAKTPEEFYPHLYPATQTDLFILLPATADMIGRIAHGFGTDLVSTCALSLPATAQRLFCPAMNVEMWNQPIVQKNVALLEQAGWLRLGPNTGALACGMEGPGRMAEPKEIIDVALPLLARRNLLAGKKILILSGPTREHLDPVRFIGNPSTGKMGKALAEEAVASGAEVDFVTGPVAEANEPRNSHIRIQRITNAQELLAAAQALQPQADILIYAAAVADYQPAEFNEKKLPKHSGELSIRVIATPDVAATLNQKKRDHQVAIGFALQTHDGADEARAKLKKKRFDGIVLNALDALGGDSGTYHYLSAHDNEGFANWGNLNKRACARRILDEAIKGLAKIRNSKSEI